MLSALRPFVHHFTQRLSHALPSSCALCGSSANDALCASCRTQFFNHHPVRCTRCAITLPYARIDSNAPCGDCLKLAPAFDATVVATDYTAPVDQLVLALKFGGQLALAPLFSQLLHDEWQRSQSNALALPSLLTVVPLGSQRLAERGFNQAQEIARPLAHALGIPLVPHLAVRVRDTAAQAMLPPEDRRKNIRKAFTIAPDAMDRIQGQHIGVVDDVMTTGETLGELAATLKRFGASRVTNLVFARAPH